jgi:hypothetical protein
MEQSLKRRTGLIGLITIIGSVAGCAGTPKDNGGGNPPPSVAFTFDVAAVMTSGNVTNIDVTPNPPPTAGLYKGGHARLEMQTGATRSQIVWQSNSPFWIKFEPLKSDKGHGGGTICENTEPSTYTKSSGMGPYHFECLLIRGGGKTLSVKYHLTTQDPASPPTFELDPVIIVDR